MNLDELKDLISVEAESSGLLMLEFSPILQENLVRVILYKKEGVSHGDCMQIARFVNDTVADSSLDKYRFEVGSPGLDRKLKNLEEANVLSGEKAFIYHRTTELKENPAVGILQGFEDGVLTFLDLEDNEIKLDKIKVKKVKLAG